MKNEEVCVCVKMKIVFAVICRKASNAAHHDAVSVHEAGRTRVPVLHMHKAKCISTFCWCRNRLLV